MRVLKNRYYPAGSHVFPPQMERTLIGLLSYKGLLQQPICQKRLFGSCRLKGRALSPEGCKIYPGNMAFPGDSGAEKFHEMSRTRGRPPQSDKGYLFMAFGFAESYPYLDK